MKMVFSQLSPASDKYVKPVERELIKLEAGHAEDAKTVRRLVYHLVEIIGDTDQVPNNLDSFQDWKLDAGSIHTEFSRVANATFKKNTNWGRVIMFLGFAVSFAVHLEQGIVVGSADSVLGWTCQVIDEDLEHFYTSHQGWEGFYKYLEIVNKKDKKSLWHVNEKERGSLWHVAVAAVGAMVALTLKQVFSNLTYYSL